MCLFLYLQGLDEQPSILAPVVYVGAETARNAAPDLSDSLVLLPREPSAADSATLEHAAEWAETLNFDADAFTASWKAPPHPTAPLPAQLGNAYPHPPSWYNAVESGCTSSSRRQLGATCGHLGRPKVL